MCRSMSTKMETHMVLVVGIILISRVLTSQLCNISNESVSIVSTHYNNDGIPNLNSSCLTPMRTKPALGIEFIGGWNELQDFGGIQFKAKTERGEAEPLGIYNFMGRELRLTYVTILAKKHGGKVLISNSGKETIELLGTQILDHFLYAFAQDVLNFTAHLHPASTWGALFKENNSWNGMAGLLEERKADYAGDGTYFIKQRVANFRLLVLGYDVYFAAYFQLPPRTSDGYKDIGFYPLRKVWIPFVVSLLVIFGLLKLLFRLDFSSSLVFVAGNFANQGMSITMNIAEIVYIHSLRIFIVVITIYLYVVNLHSQSLMISKFSKHYKTISSFQDLLNENYRFILLNESGSAYGDLPEGMSLSEISKYPLTYLTMNEGVDLLLSEKYQALISDTEAVESIDKILWGTRETHFCDAMRQVAILEKPLRSNGFVRKGSSFSDPLNYALIKIWATGNFNRYLQRFRRREHDARPQCVGKDQDDSIHLPQIQSVYCTLLAGFVLSILVYLIEMLETKRKLLYM